MGRSVILAGRSIQSVGATVQHCIVLLPAHRRPKAASKTGTSHLTSSKMSYSILRVATAY